MAGFNQIFVHGFACNDPELKTSKNGGTFSRFRIGHSTGQGKAKKDTYYNVTCFGTVAENVVKFVSKGDQVIVMGSVELTEWKTKAGEKVKEMRITAHNIRNIFTKEKEHKEDENIFEADEEDVF